jgi:hypothetical protein
VSSLILEVLAYSLRTHAVEFGRVTEYSPFKAILCKKIQFMIEAHVSPERFMQTPKTRFPRRVIAIGTAIYNKSPNAIAVCEQLFLDPVGRVWVPITAGDGAFDFFTPWVDLRWTIRTVLDVSLCRV